MKRMSRGGRLILCVILTAACLWAGWALGAGAEEKGTTVTGYFEQSAFARPEMAMSEDYVAWIPAYTVVTMEPVDGAWAVYTSPEGKRGYVRYGKLLPIPEYEAEAESYVYSGKPMDVRNLPSYDAQTAFRTEPYELLTVNGRIKGYSHVVREDSSEGYIVSAWAVKAEFTPTPITPVVLCVAEETPVTDLPLLGAHRIGSLQPDRFYRAEAVSGNYYALTMDGQTGYVEILRTALCAFQGGNDRSFFTVPRVGGQTWMSGIETIYASAILPEGGADLYQTDGTRKRLEGGLRGYAYTACGAWVGAAFGDQAGYLRREEVQVQMGEMLLSRLRETDLSGGKKERSVFLDQAFRMVEEGNPFQARYNLLTGADIRSVLPLGVPYFWGGRNWRAAQERLPNYTTRAAWQSSPVYYRKGTVYLYGFDCIGFVRSVYALAGKPISGSTTGHRDWAYCHAGEHVYCDDVYPLPADWAEAASGMEAGDFMVIHHPGTHALLYMGTLRDYGYTEDQLPALKKYLDYPLMMQSGENPYSYLRFQSMISASEDRRTAGATPPDGGVSICIPGVPPEEAEMVITCHGQTYRCFDVEGCCVTILDWSTVKDYFVSRPGAVREKVVLPEESLESMDETEAAGDEYLTEETAAPETTPGEAE